MQQNVDLITTAPFRGVHSRIWIFWLSKMGYFLNKKQICLGIISSIQDLYEKRFWDILVYNTFSNLKATSVSSVSAAVWNVLHLKMKVMNYGYTKGASKFY